MREDTESLVESVYWRKANGADESAYTSRSSRRAIWSKMREQEDEDEEATQRSDAIRRTGRRLVRLARGSESVSPPNATSARLYSTPISNQLSELNL